MASYIWCSNLSNVTNQCSQVLCFVLLLIIILVQPGIISARITTATTTTTTTARLEPSSDFSRHSVIHPKVYHARTKREISSTKENDLKHTELLTVGFTLDGIERVLDLRLNNDLIPVGHKQRYQIDKGLFKVHEPSKEEIEICQYQGNIRGVPNSWAAVSTCNGLSGVVFDGETLRYIHPQEESLDAPHFIYKHDDLSVNNTCGYVDKQRHNVYQEANRMLRYKRDAGVIRGPYNANKQSRYVELVMVIDKKGYSSMGENLDKVYHHCKDIVNIINALYTPLNIFIALVGVEVWLYSDEIPLSSNGEKTLTNFLQYRRERLVRDIPNDNAQLLTRVKFDGGVVGKALKGPICTFEFSGGVSIDHSDVVGLVAATVAHEMGHNFGMEHDNSECSCPEERCIMAPSSGSTGPTHWSSCSLEYLASAFEHGMDYCLRNKPEKLFGSSMCGNGFVEPGEQCDCGLEGNCNNPCCNATTCMLHGNASCATGECCDLKTCRPKTAGTECRLAEHECDLPEYCTGQSEYCPSDVFKIDGETCSMGKAFCYQGSCRTRNDQCKLLWGPSGSSSDSQCYDMNNKGTKFGNCGYNRVNNTYIKCTDLNNQCGMLHCKHLNERLEFGMESVATLSHSFLNSGGEIIPCRTAIVDLGLNQVDPGLVPDGAKCDVGKMCVNQKCMPVAAMRLSSSAGADACPNNCSGNGVCNSLGHCHCNRGFKPPLCDEIGAGGSLDSGPVEDPNARRDFIISLYVIFFGIVPIVALIALFVWSRHNGRYKWKKGSTSAYVFDISCFKLKHNRSSNNRLKTECVSPDKCSCEKCVIENEGKINTFRKLMPQCLTRKFDNDRNARKNESRVFTISDNVVNKHQLQITKTDLVSTTNPEVVNGSNYIESRKSMLYSNERMNFDIQVQESRNSLTNLPQKKEFGTMISEQILNLQNKPVKNFKNLKLTTELKFQHLNESPCSTAGVSSHTAESMVSNSEPQPSILFYNKKAPPPPPPAQGLKPKLWN